MSEQNMKQFNLRSVTYGYINHNERMWLPFFDIFWASHTSNRGIVLKRKFNFGMCDRLV